MSGMTNKDAAEVSVFFNTKTHKNLSNDELYRIKMLLSSSNAHEHFGEKELSSYKDMINSMLQRVVDREKSKQAHSQKWITIILSSVALLLALIQVYLQLKSG